MIIVAYPCATGGNFLASLIALILNNDENTIDCYGRLHSTPIGYSTFYANNASVDTNSVDQEWSSVKEFLVSNSNTNKILSGHFRDFQSITDNIPNVKIVYITVDPKLYPIQETNFVNKILMPMWSLEFYNAYRTNAWPKFDSTISNMPTYVIDEILSINRHYIRNWKYFLSNNSSLMLETPLKLQSTPAVLIQQVIDFLDVKLNSIQFKKVLQFAEQYKQINKY
jgi:hypothetical protein